VVARSVEGVGEPAEFAAVRPVWMWSGRAMADGVVVALGEGQGGFVGERVEKARQQGLLALFMLGDHDCQLAA